MGRGRAGAARVSGEGGLTTPLSGSNAGSRATVSVRSAKTDTEMIAVGLPDVQSDRRQFRCASKKATVAATISSSVSVVVNTLNT